MRIDAIRAWAFDAPLTRPYAISGGSWDSVEMAFVALRTDAGVEGFGMASPATEVTGETRADSLRELEGAGWLRSRDAGDTAHDDADAKTAFQRRGHKAYCRELGAWT